MGFFVPPTSGAHDTKHSLSVGEGAENAGFGVPLLHSIWIWRCVSSRDHGGGMEAGWDTGLAPSAGQGRARQVTKHDSPEAVGGHTHVPSRVHWVDKDVGIL